MLKLFPDVLIRVSARPFPKLESLTLRNTSTILTELETTRAGLEILKNTLSNALHSLIGQITDSVLQNRLLNLRRDIFNNRPISAYFTPELQQVYTTQLAQQLNSYTEILQQIEQLLAKGEQEYTSELLKIRGNLKLLASDEQLQKGLILSSQVLLEQLKTYIVKKSESLDKKDIQTEKGIIKYLTRMYTKTSPFSTFTNLTIGKIASTENTSAYLHTKEENVSVLSHIRLNNALFQYLKTLFYKNKTMYLYFRLRPNPTIRREEESYVYLTNHQNIEAFQRMPYNQVLELMLEITSEKKEGVLFNEIIKNIIENEYIDASAEQLEGYIQQLIEYGFLEYNLGVSGIDPDWDIHLIQKIGEIKENNTYFAELITVLGQLRTIAEQFSKAPFSERKYLLDRAYEQFRGICMKIHEQAGLPANERKTKEELQEEWNKQVKNTDKPSEETENRGEDTLVFKHQSLTYFYIKPEQMFYEDTTLQTTPVLDEKQLLPLVTPFNELIELMYLFEGGAYERDKMYDYYSKKYGNTEVELLRFYEDYYREIKKPEMEIQEKQKKELRNKAEVQGNNVTIEPMAIPEIVKNRQLQSKQWLDAFGENIKEHITNHDEVRFTLKNVRDIHSTHTPPSVKCSLKNSRGMFVQLYTTTNTNGKPQLMGVLNNPLPGYGKWISRFLHIFDKSVTENVRNWNQNLTTDEYLYVENTDASVFNANLHPTLMPFEVWMPGGQNSLPAEKHIPITEMLVKQENNKLQLIHKSTKKPIYIFDLGFQGIKGRSQLYQLLSHFSPIEHTGYMPLCNTITGMYQMRAFEQLNDKEKTKKRVVLKPRIVFENCLVLQRKTWLVPKELLPIRKPLETEWQYFEKVNEWRKKNNIPVEVFISLVDKNEIENLSAQERKKINKDDYKPQYIHFENPVLVHLFEKLQDKVPVMLKMEEMLPGSGNLTDIAGNKHITESLIQWYTDSNYIKV